MDCCWLLLIHFDDEIIDLIFTVSSISSIAENLFLPVQDTGLWLVEFQGSQEPHNLSEMITNSCYLIDNVFYAKDTMFS